MAGEWIKMRGSLLSNPRVIRIARLLIGNADFMAWYLGTPRDVTGNEAPLLHGSDRAKSLIQPVTRVTVGALLSLWSTVNECAGACGVLKGADLFEVDVMCGVPGISIALQRVGWIEVLSNEEGLRFINFHEHNTVTKERSTGAKTNAERQADLRARRKAEAQERDAGSNGKSNVTRNRRKEKRREEEKDTHGAGGRAGEAGGVCASDGIPNPEDTSPAAMAWRALAPCGDALFGDGKVDALLQRGATVGQLAAAAQGAVAKGKGVAYAIGIVSNQLGEAGRLAAGPAAVAAAWDSGRSGIESMGESMGVGRWDESAAQLGRGESFAVYEARVRAAVQSRGSGHAH